MTNKSRFPAVSSRVIVATMLGYTCMATSASAQTTIALTHYNYDAAERMQCTTVRMNPAAFGSLPTDACALGTEGTNGPDRVTRYSRDAAGRPLQIQLAYGTSAQATDRTFTYTQDGMVLSMADANNNLTTMTYDGYDRLSVMNFPNPSKAGSSSGSDYEEYGYDGNGNRTSLRKRDGHKFTFCYDALNRQTAKLTVATTCGLAQYATQATRNVFYEYDLWGRQTEARFDAANGAERVENGYDGFGRLSATATIISGVSRSLSFGYDADGNRTSVVHPDGQKFSFSYDGLDRLNGVYEGEVTSGVRVDTFVYGADGYQLSRLDPNAAGSCPRSGGRPMPAFATGIGYCHDAIGRLDVVQIAIGAAGTTTLGYNPAGQITSETRSNDAYAVTGATSTSRSYTPNGLNQYANIDNVQIAYDANGNLLNDGTNSYGYDAENRLVSGPGGASLIYDPLGRLWSVATAAQTTQFLYDGDQLTAEYDTGGNLLHRYVHGPGEDDPLFWYQGGGVGAGNRRALIADHEGSIVQVVNGAGQSLAVNGYDEYGQPAANGLGRFRYTGQAWLPELGLYHYKARVYSPKLGRFLQTDPVGYKDQINLYAYVANDPVNKTDPSGDWECGKDTDCNVVQSMVDGVRTARDTYAVGSADYKRLDADVRDLGVRGDGGVSIKDGVVVLNGKVNTGSSGALTGPNEITLNLKNIKDGAYALSPDPKMVGKFGAVTLGHEDDHHHSGFDLSTVDERTKSEDSAYRTGDAVLRAFDIRQGTNANVQGMSKEQMIHGYTCMSVNASLGSSVCH